MKRIVVSVKKKKTRPFLGVLGSRKIKTYIGMHIHVFKSYQVNQERGKGGKRRKQGTASLGAMVKGCCVCVCIRESVYERE